jgi:hypothetical protein
MGPSRTQVSLIAELPFPQPTGPQRDNNYDSLTPVRIDNRAANAHLRNEQVNEL